MSEAAARKLRARTLWLGLALVGLCLAIFARSVDFQPLELDDPTHVFRNPFFHPPTIAGIAGFWGRAYFSLYIPLTYTVWGVVALLTAQESGGQVLLPAAPFHLLNVVLHTANTLLVFSVLRALLERSRPRLEKERRVTPTVELTAAGVGAALFACHPAQVESVAWISGMRDLLSVGCSLVAMRFYLGASGKSRPLALALFAFLLALTSKPTAAVLPAALWGMDVWLFDETPRRATARLWPAFVLGAAALGLAKWLQPDSSLEFHPPLWSRPFIAGDALAFYLYKLVFPFRSAFDYGRNPQFVLAHAWLFVTWVAPAAVGLAAFRFRFRQPWWAVGLGLFALGLLPVLGLVSFDFQIFSTVCDHYLYFPMIGAAFCLACLYRNLRAAWARGAILAGLLGLALVAQLQLDPWHDSVALFQHSLEVNPQSPILQANLGASLFDLGRFQEAVEHYRIAAELKPTSAEMQASLGQALSRAGRAEEALAVFRHALELNPDSSYALLGLAGACLRHGIPSAAEEPLLRELRQHPDNRLALQLLSEARAASSRLPAASQR